MNRKDIIRMASSINEDWWLDDMDLEAFAQLVAFQYEKKIADLENIIARRHWDVLQEREACAKLVEPDDEHRRDASWAYLGGTEGVTLLDEVAAQIRARGQQ